MVKIQPSLNSPSSRFSFADWSWVHYFLITQFILKVLLLFPQFGVLRAPMRIAAFGASLFLLAWLPEPGQKLPGKGIAIGIMIILLMQLFFNSNLNSVTAGIAQCTLYLSIVAPIFWVSRLKVTPTAFLSLIYILWAFETLSSLAGVLQMYFPGQFQPFLSTTIQNQQWGGENLKIILANGATVYRPMGLTDAPGGAARSGFFSIILGFGFLLQSKIPLVKIIGILSAGMGLFCIYLSQVRSLLIVSIVCLIGITITLLRQGKFTQVFLLGLGGFLLFSFIFSWATLIGGEATLDRFLSLTADDPVSVYQKNRGLFLTHSLTNLLPKFPLGAGLGRWGIANGFFGDSSNPFAQAIWVEIEWTGWLLDGGIPLIIAYASAIFIFMRECWNIALKSEDLDLRLWGSVIFAYDLSIVVSTFNSASLIGQSGLEFWLINATILMAALSIKPNKDRNTNALN